jgi:hypothetical protein
MPQNRFLNYRLATMVLAGWFGGYFMARQRNPSVVTGEMTIGPSRRILLKNPY